VILALVLTAGTGQAAERPPEARVEVQAVRLSEPIRVDGVLSEEVWSTAPPATGFLQRDPTEGAAASEKTEVRVAYDDQAIYVGARMYDSDPAAIVARLGRRDAWLDADAFVFYLDSYHDRRTGYLFSVNAAGTLWDGVLYNDDWDDSSWDGVWEGRAHVDERGWTVEMRIPYSQVRFRDAPSHRWGMNARRHIARKKEDDYLAYTPKKASGFVSRFLDLVGIERIRPPRRLSLSPYATSRAEYAGHDAGDPFNDGSRYRSTVGADLKMGLGSNLTLDATVNPDFGQVEVDPAVVNLSDVETYFEEKRPFFLEGARIFDFGQGGATNYFGFNWWGPDLFYSRRIGRVPQGSLPDAEFTDVPAGVKILGAGKLTGKLGRDWNFGMLHAVTERERARLFAGSQSFRADVEPAAYYGVVRAQRQFPENRHGIGVLGTFARRFFGGSTLRDQVNSEAAVMGLDGWTFLDAKKTWVVTGWLAGSRVSGSRARIFDLQQNPQHYFQRPDVTHVHLDPDATSLSGWAGRATINKEKGSWLLNAALGAIAPGFEVNDLGFFGRTDLVNGHVWTSHRWTEPGRFSRKANLDLAYFHSSDFGGHRTWEGLFGYGGLTLLNYYSFTGWLAYNPDTLSPFRTRGGPLTLNPNGFEWDSSVRSDERKKLIVRLGYHGWSYSRSSSSGYYLGPTVEWRPSSNVLLSVGPSLNVSHEGAQWIGNFADPAATATFGTRYVFAPLEQKTFSASLRANWTFSPRLSLQLYAQPLVSAGEYSNFGELARPRSFDFVRYGPVPPVEFDNPDFNFRSLRGNAILRWEFRPGSTAYLVWTQTRSDEDETGTFRLGHSVGRLFDARADNIVLLKIAYWISR
jgi:hypothetical protein